MSLLFISRRGKKVKVRVIWVGLGVGIVKVAGTVFGISLVSYIFPESWKLRDILGVQVLGVQEQKKYDMAI